MSSYKNWTDYFLENPLDVTVPLPPGKLLSRHSNARWHGRIKIRVWPKGESTRTIDFTPAPVRYLVLTISGEIFRNPERPSKDSVCAGQCAVEIRECWGDNLPPTFERLLDIWDNFHLNDLNSGTRGQRAYLKDHLLDNPDAQQDFSSRLASLREAGLDVDRGYGYGSGWLLEILPEQVLAEIADIAGLPASVLQFNDTTEPASLSPLRAKIEEWFADPDTAVCVFENRDLGHRDLGARCALPFTLADAARMEIGVSRAPDTKTMIGWRWVLVGKYEVDRKEEAVSALLHKTH